MGGFGSGRWGWVARKRCVEECTSIDTAHLRHNGWLRPGAILRGELSWTRGESEPAGKIGFITDLTESRFAFARLTYSLSEEQFDYTVPLVRTHPHLGGTRWWFICPLRHNGVACNRRVRKLYRVGRYFGCRHCHNLTYRSRQEHDPRVSRLMKHPELISAMLNGRGGGNPLLAIKAGLNLAIPRNRVEDRKSRPH